MKLTPFFTVLNQIKVYHWQTKSYSEHRALNSAYEELDELFDKFVECYMGKKGREEKKSEYVIKLKSYDSNFTLDLNYIFDKFTEIINSMVDDSDTELLNIRDEILGEFDKLKYLLTLK